MPRQANPAKPVLENIAASQKAVNAAERELKKHLNTLLTDHAPVKKGDIVKVTGYSHGGKSMTVDRVVISDGYSGGHRFKVTGWVNKSDGTPGKFRGESLYELKAAK